MIISHRYKFIFIKTMKTAGTSTEIALSRFCEDKDIITEITDDDEKIRQDCGYPGPQNYYVPYSRYSLRDWKHMLFERTKCCFYNHIPAIDIRRWIGKKVWDSYYKFCFDRNPWDKAISLYYFFIGINNFEMSFQEFMERRHEFPILKNQFSNFSIYTIDGKSAVDYLGRYESLQDDLDKIARTVGLPERLELPRAKGHYRKRIQPYNVYFGRKEKDIIADVCRNEIDLLGYEF